MRKLFEGRNSAAETLGFQGFRVLGAYGFGVLGVRKSAFLGRWVWPLFFLASYCLQAVAPLPKPNIQDAGSVAQETNTNKLMKLCDSKLNDKMQRNVVPLYNSIVYLYVF